MELVKHAKALVATGMMLFALGCHAEQAGGSEYTVITRAQLDSFTGKAIYSTENFVYVGELKSGKRHGYGVSYGKDSSVIAGEWRNDKLQGEAVMVDLAANTVSAGHYEQDYLVGTGAITMGEDAVVGEHKSDSPIPLDPTCYKAGSEIPCKESELFK